MNAKLVTLFLLFAVFWVCSTVNGASVVEQCTNELQKVTACLGFATGKATTPTKECCGAVTDIKDNNPVCLCYVIEQIHNGTNPALKSMGIKEELLLQLPSACKLANASSAECPKLLNLPPNSPEASIFSNVTGSTTPSSDVRGTSGIRGTSAGTGASTTNSESSPSSTAGIETVPGLAASGAIAVFVVFCITMFT